MRSPRECDLPKDPKVPLSDCPAPGNDERGARPGRGAPVESRMNAAGVVRLYRYVEPVHM